MRKRANGEGTIYRRKDGRWSGQVTTGYTPEGKQIRKTIYGDTQAEVRKQMESLRSRPIQPEASPLLGEATGREGISAKGFGCPFSREPTSLTEVSTRSGTPAPLSCSPRTAT